MAAADPEFLRAEYFQLQQTVEKFDEKALTIKAWSVTFSMAGFATAFIEGVPALLLLSSFASLLFWLIEGHWKVFQQAYYPRILEIEALMAGQEVGHATAPYIATSWSRAWHRYTVAHLLIWPHVFLPHAIVFVGGLLAWALNLRLGFIRP